MKIAIDGTAASGKGTLGKNLSNILDLPYLDTGLLYRKAASLYINYQNSNITEKINFKVLDNILNNINFEKLDKKNLKKESYGVFASKISKLLKVREKLNKIQIIFANQMSKKRGGCILDGRDIGTVILPNADYKFFVDAHIEIRAKRRYNELLGSSNFLNYDNILDNLKKRDNDDKKRENSPLVCAHDAIYIDTSSISPEDVTNIALTHIKKYKEK